MTTRRYIAYIYECAWFSFLPTGLFKRRWKQQGQQQQLQQYRPGIKIKRGVSYCGHHVTVAGCCFLPLFQHGSVRQSCCTVERFRLKHLQFPTPAIISYHTYRITQRHVLLSTSPPSSLHYLEPISKYWKRTP